MSGDTVLEERLKNLRRIVEEGQRAAAELAELMELRRLMQKYNVKAAEPIKGALSQVANHIANTAAASAAETVKDRVLGGAEAVLIDGKRRRPRQLLEEMAKIGVTVPGRDPAANLSSYLSREKDRFESDQGLGGWTLKRLTKKASPYDAPTPQGLMFPTNRA